MKYLTIPLLATALSVTSLSTQAAYSLIPLVTPNADYIEISGLNSAGQVSGMVRTTDGNWHATRWDQGLATYLTAAPWGNDTVAKGINDAGQIAGYAYDAATWTYTPIVWTGNTASALQNLPGQGAVASGLNDKGDVVGYSFGEGGQAVLWTQGQATVLTGTQGMTVAYDINNAGQILGSFSSDGLGHPVVWDKGSVIELPTGARGAYPTDINDAGQVSAVNGDMRFVWNLSDGTSYTAASESVLSINNHGEAAGSKDGRPTLWRNGEVIDLSDQLDASFIAQGWRLTAVGRLNDVGAMMGLAQLQGQSYYVLLTPVPEPGTAALMLMVIPFAAIGAAHRGNKLAVPFACGH